MDEKTRGLLDADHLTLLVQQMPDPSQPPPSSASTSADASASTSADSSSSSSPLSSHSDTASPEGTVGPVTRFHSVPAPVPEVEQDCKVYEGKKAWKTEGGLRVCGRLSVCLECVQCIRTRSHW